MFHSRIQGLGVELLVPCEVTLGKDQKTTELTVSRLLQSFTFLRRSMTIKSSRGQNMLDAANRKSLDGRIVVKDSRIPRWLARVLSSSARELSGNFQPLISRHGNHLRHEMQRTENYLPGPLGLVTKMFLPRQADTGVRDK